MGKHLVSVMGMKNLADFKAMFDIYTVKEVVEKVEGLQQIPLQASRVKQAYEAVKDASGIADTNRKRTLEEDDMDELLPLPVLTRLKEQFLSRYHMRYHPTVEPSDYLVSKLHKKMEKRMMGVDELWTTKTLSHMNKTETKKHKLAGGLSLVEGQAEADVPVSKCLNTYLTVMFTYCIALARAGSEKMQKAPREQPMSVKTTNCVWVPLDLIIAYHERARRSAVRMLEKGHSESQTLRWILEVDGDERAKWVEEFRGSEYSLGQVIEMVMKERESAWRPPERAEASAPAPRQQPQAMNMTPDRSSATAKAKSNNAKLTPQKPSGGNNNYKDLRVINELRDGKKICEAWNRGEACPKKCKYGKLHVCNVEIKGQRACGLRNHRAIECRNPKMI